MELNFAFVYTMEAHAADKWPMKWAVEWPEPRTFEERIACACKCDQDLGWSPEVTFFVDTMDNEFCRTFGTWSVGCYVLSPTRRLLFVGEPKTHDVFFDIEQLFSFLRRLSPQACQSSLSYVTIDSSSQTAILAVAQAAYPAANVMCKKRNNVSEIVSDAR